MKMTTFSNLQSQQGQQTSVDWGGFCRLIHDVPAYPEKSQQPLIKLGVFQDNNRAAGNELLKFDGLELDYDSGEITPPQAADTLRGAGITAIVCSTYTSTPQHPKWRVFLPLSKPYAAKHRAALVGACDAVLGHVIAPESYTPKQIFFVGRNPATDYQVIEITGAALDTVPQVQQLARAFVAEQKQQAQAAQQSTAKAMQRATVERLAPGQISVIESFNQAYDVRAILSNHGYQKKGKRYLSPYSKSGLAGVVVLDCGGQDKAYSHHTSGDPLGNGHANDAFDCFALLEHGGDVIAAIQAAGNLLFVGGDTLNQHNRKMYRVSRRAA